MKKTDYKPKKDVQECLFDDFNLKLFDNLTDRHHNDEFYEPLTFFNLLYKCLEIVKANKNRPIDVAKYFESRFFPKSIPESNYQEHLFLLFSLNQLAENHSDCLKDNELRTCRIFMNKMYSRLCFEEYPYERKLHTYTEEEIVEMEKEFEWDFLLHMHHINTIKDPKEKLRYLIDKKAEYLIKYGTGGPFPKFPDQCDAEINRIKELEQLIGQFKSDNVLKSIWMPEAKISIQEFLQAGVDKGIWGEQYQIITKKNSLYGTGKTLLGSLFIALKGFAISENIDYKIVGKAFCEFFHVDITTGVKEPYKAFSSGNQRLIKRFKMAFGNI